ncbi:glycosyl transferase [Pedobacter sp. PAMC26386]|nr:glycosyl transferase [Pedobacter sp. PAMC26386]
MLKFCTLFNTTYLSRGLAMYNSLEQHCESFHLYIFAFDTHCFDLLTKMALKNASIISLTAFENDRLLAIKDDRTAGEYCWTCASSTIKYCLEKYALDHCTYVDADLLFFNDPACLIAEMGEKSVSITEHRYTPIYDQSVTSGIYCVQFMTFKNTREGLEVLNWWVDACIEWCFNRFEDNKFGDQKYLDDWTTRFNTVHILRNLGSGLAPWNVQQYDFATKGHHVQGKEVATETPFDLVFYHFHDFQYIKGNTYRLSTPAYHLSRNVIKHIYKPYTKALSVAEAEIYNINTEITAHELSEDSSGINLVIGRMILFFLLGYYKNFYTKRSMEYGFLSMKTFRLN